MKKILILIFLGAFSTQLSCMDDNNSRPIKKQKTDVIENETKEKEEKNYAEIELAKQKTKFEEFYNQNYRQLERAGGYATTHEDASLLNTSNIISKLFKPQLMSRKELQLEFAIAYNYLELAKDALNQGAYPNIMLDGADSLLLGHAIDHNYIEMLSLLLNDPKIDVNAYEQSSGYSSMMYAIASHSPEIVELLIKAGANVKHELNNGNTALIRLFDIDDDVYAHIDEDAEEYIQYMKCAKILVENGVEINSKNDEGNTALMEAVRVNFLPLEVIRFLVNKLNAKVDIKNTEGETALDFAKKAYKDACKNKDINLENTKEILDFLERSTQKEKAFIQKIIKNEILESTPIPDALAKLTSQYLEDTITIQIV